MRCTGTLHSTEQSGHLKNKIPIKCVSWMIGSQVELRVKVMGPLKTATVSTLISKQTKIKMFQLLDMQVAFLFISFVISR